MFSLFFGRSSILDEDDFDTDFESMSCGSGNPSLTPEAESFSSVSTVLLVKQAELSNIIADMQRQILSTRRKVLHRPDHWYDALYNKLNAQLWRWHDSLPGELRWNRWSSNLEMVDPSLSPLQYVLCLWYDP